MLREELLHAHREIGQDSRGQGDRAGEDARRAVDAAFEHEHLDRAGVRIGDLVLFHAGTGVGVLLLTAVESGSAG